MCCTLYLKYSALLISRYDEMQRVEFDRTGGSSRSFDIKVTNIHDITYTFSSIGKPFYDTLAQSWNWTNANIIYDKSIPKTNKLN